VARTSSEGGGASPGGARPSQANRADQGMVIAAFARARLLGLKILTLDARIVLLPTDAAADSASLAVQAKAVRPTSRSHEAPRADLARAVHLLEQSTKSLDEARVMRTLK